MYSTAAIWLRLRLLDDVPTYALLRITTDIMNISNAKTCFLAGRLILC